MPCRPGSGLRPRKAARFAPAWRTVAWRSRPRSSRPCQGRDTLPARALTHFALASPLATGGASERSRMEQTGSGTRRSPDRLPRHEGCGRSKACRRPSGHGSAEGGERGRDTSGRSLAGAEHRVFACPRHESPRQFSRSRWSPLPPRKLPFGGNDRFPRTPFRVRSLSRRRSKNQWSRRGVEPVAPQTSSGSLQRRGNQRFPLLSVALGWPDG